MGLVFKTIFGYVFLITKTKALTTYINSCVSFFSLFCCILLPFQNFLLNSIPFCGWSSKKRNEKNGMVKTRDTRKRDIFNESGFFAWELPTFHLLLTTIFNSKIYSIWFFGAKVLVFFIFVFCFLFHLLGKVLHFPRKKDVACSFVSC